MLMTASLLLMLAGLTKLLLTMPGDSKLGGWLALLAAVVLIPFWWDSLKTATFASRRERALLDETEQPESTGGGTVPGSSRDSHE